MSTAASPVTSAREPAALRLAALVLSIVGLAVSAYLTFEHFTSSVSLACPDTGVINCAKVTTSEYSTIMGIPVAVLGLVFFVAMTVLCSPPAWRLESSQLPRARTAAASVGVVSVLYLVWAELFQIHAICLWCTVVHVISVALFCVLVMAAALRH